MLWLPTRQFAQLYQPAIVPRRLLRAEYGIERVAQGIAEQVEAEHREADSDSLEDRYPGGALGVLLGPALEHQAPGRSRFLNPQPQERQNRLEQDRLADEAGNRSLVDTQRNELMRNTPDFIHSLFRGENQLLQQP